MPSRSHKARRRRSAPPDAQPTRQVIPLALGWHRDRAAYGGWRSRFWTRDGGELSVEDTGAWGVCIPSIYWYVAFGREDTLELGKARALKVYEALTDVKPESMLITDFVHG